MGNLPISTAIAMADEIMVVMAVKGLYCMQLTLPYTFSSVYNFIK
jgi:hypothetical protein